MCACVKERESFSFVLFVYKNDGVENFTSQISPSSVNHVETQLQYANICSKLLTAD